MPTVYWKNNPIKIFIQNFHIAGFLLREKLNLQKLNFNNRQILILQQSRLLLYIYQGCRESSSLNTSTLLHLNTLFMLTNLKIKSIRVIQNTLVAKLWFPQILCIWSINDQVIRYIYYNSIPKINLHLQVFLKMS